jgi:uncharacterized protein (TIGR02757 family)
MLNKTDLDKIYSQYTKRGLVSPDPLQFLYDYTGKADVEIVALIASCFAYGNVKQIIKTVAIILKPMGASPKKFLLSSTEKDLNMIYEGFKYRFTEKQGLVNLLRAIRKVIKLYGSLENLFLGGKGDYLDKQRNFARVLRSFGNINTLMPDPDKGSAMKRLNLCLRWLIRKDAVDLGYWTKISPAELIAPLDVHLHRVARMLSLTNRNQADMKTALEISASFAKFCPQDPIKYDFCLTRFGIRDDMSEDELKKYFSDNLK